jgi:hypothetical protein
VPPAPPRGAPGAARPSRNDAAAEVRAGAGGPRDTRSDRAAQSLFAARGTGRRDGAARVPSQEPTERPRAGRGLSGSPEEPIFASSALPALRGAPKGDRTANVRATRCGGAGWCSVTHGSSSTTRGPAGTSSGAGDGTARARAWEIRASARRPKVHRGRYVARRDWVGRAWLRDRTGDIVPCACTACRSVRTTLSRGGVE